MISLKGLTLCAVLVFGAVVLSAQPPDWLCDLHGVGQENLGRLPEEPGDPGNQFQDRVWLLDQSTKYYFNNSWDPQNLYKYTYNEINQLVLIETSGYNSGIWNPFGYREYSYTPTGQIHETIYLGISDGIMYRRYLESYIYNATDHLIQKSEYVINNNEGFECYRTLYEYSSGVLMGKKMYALDEDGLLQDFCFTDYEYNGSGQLTLEHSQRFDWAPNSQILLYNYNANGSLSMVVYQSPFGVNNAWVDYFRWIYTYDVNGYLTEYKQQDLYNGESWNDNRRYCYTNDCNGNDVLEEYQRWNGEGWVDWYKWIKVYSNTSAEDENVPGACISLSCYPNPVHKGETAIIKVIVAERESGTLNVFNLRGQTISTQQLSPGTHQISLDSSDLPSGIYFCQLRTPSGTEVRKLVILK